MPEDNKMGINEFVSWIVRGLLVIVIIESIFTQKYQNTFIGVLSVLMTFYPSLLKKRFRVYLPTSLQLLITFFIFAAEFLGEFYNFYYKFPWWDNMLHLISGSVLGIIGFMFVYFLNKTHIKETRLSPFFIVLFAFCFSVTIGVFWEFFEFSVDRLFGFNMQKFRLPEEDGLIDTMVDLFVDTFGAFIVSAVGYVYMKKNRKTNVKRWIKRQSRLEMGE